MNAYLAKLGFSANEYNVVDGSGLSHENRLSARVITALLLKVHRQRILQPEFEKSLSVMGQSGTLKKRKPPVSGLRLRGKTGTLDGVSSLAGYLFDVSGNKLAFAIIQNRTASRERALSLEDRLVKEFYTGGR